MSLLSNLMGLFRRNARRYSYVEIPRGRVVGAELDDAPLESGQHYFRLWLNEMHLRRDRDWFSTWYPAVHSVVRLQFGSRTVEIPHIAGSLNLPQINPGNMDKAVQLNHALTTLMPFSGGTVELSAGLLAMQGKNLVNSFIKVVGDMAKLLVVPQLSTALGIAQPLADSIQELLGTTNGEMHLGLHQTFTGKGGGGANELRAGYFCVLLATSEEVPSHRLWVAGDRLQEGDSAGSLRLFERFPFMLFRVEKRVERDDYESFESIKEPFDKAVEALLASPGDPSRAAELLGAAKLAVVRSPDLTAADRFGLVKSLEEKFARMREQLGVRGAVPVTRPSLREVAAAVERPERLPEPSWSALEEMIGELI